MKQLKKTLLTLVALLAVTTGAWATAGVKLTTVELVPTDAWNGNNNDLALSDMPGLTADGITEDQAKAWADVPKSGTVELVYGYVYSGTYIKYKEIRFVDGMFLFSGTYFLTYDVVYNNLNSDNIKTYYATGVASSATAVDIDWNAATKTGTFTQPGGNVTVSVEYYDLATLADKGLTAAEDAAAKTEAPLAVLADGAVTGGTLMYYVATDADFSQADAIALAEDAWKAAIPTAETIDAAGTCYVWYYIKGDAEHSDTDPQRLAVTVLPAPTYAVTFAEGTPEPDKWTATPNTDVKKGDKVTVTYTGERKVIGVKAEKKAKAVPKAVTLADALVDGAVIKLNFKWAGDNTGDYVQGTYSSASGTFTTSKGGSGWAQLVGTDYKVEKDGSTIVIGVCNDSYYMEGTVWTFYVNDNTYEVTYGDNTDKAHYGLISVSVNGTDVTDQLSELK